MITSPNCLMAKIFARYFRECDYFSSGLGGLGDMASKCMMEQGCNWRVGNGKKIKIWSDPWI